MISGGFRSRAMLSGTVILNRFRAQKLSRRKKQNRAEKREQNPTSICLWNDRNGPLSTIALVVVVPFAVVLSGVGQRGEKQGGCCQCADRAEVMIEAG